MAPRTNKGCLVGAGVVGVVLGGGVGGCLTDQVLHLSEVELRLPERVNDAVLIAEEVKLSCDPIIERYDSAVFGVSGHYLHWERPETVVNCWRTFIDRS